MTEAGTSDVMSAVIAKSTTPRPSRPPRRARHHVSSGRIRSRWRVVLGVAHLNGAGLLWRSVINRKGFGNDRMSTSLPQSRDRLSPASLQLPHPPRQQEVGRRGSPMDDVLLSPAAAAMYG